jgi:hypothetical protein
MKIALTLILILLSSAFAGERYGVYDLQGNRISTFEAKPHELLEKARQIKSDNPHKKLYVAAVQKGKNSKASSRYRYKAETGAYIETSRNETFSICPDKEIQGTWVSEHSVSLSEENCLSVQAPNLAGTFRILFLQNSGRTDTIQVLVEQSYIQMGDYSHKVWTTSLDYENVTYMGDLLYGPWDSWEDIFSRNGNYESRSYNQPLIVDKTKLTIGDALYYDRTGDKILSPFTLEKDEYKNKKLEESNLPLIDVNPYSEWRFANERSKKEGLDTAYIMIHPHSKDVKKNILLGNPAHGSCETCVMLALDTSASGYRSPFEEEWMLLMRAGASTRYYWGDNKELASRYEWVRPIGLKPVAQRLPNRFGLYDMAGIASEYVISDFYKKYLNLGLSCSENLSPECILINEVGPQEEYIEPSYTECMLSSDAKEWKNLSDGKCVTKKQETKTQRVSYQSLRLLRKAPKLHKLEKL